MKVFTAGLGCETNTFSALSTGLDDFRQTFLFGPNQHPQELTEVSAPLFVLREARQTRGWEVIEGTYAFALPGGRVNAQAYVELRDRILDELRAALPVDFAAFSMHGAMAAVGCDDCEGDLLRRARGIVGDAVPIGVEIDPHAHLSAAMVENADVIIAMREYPHTDFLERAHELVKLLESAVEKRVRPVMAVYDCRTIGRFHTMREPMRGFVQRLNGYAAAVPGIVSVSFIHGFPWGDVVDMGAKMLAISNGDAALAERAATALGQEIERIRAQTFAPAVGIADALDRALDGTDGPTVVADIADNPGGGAGGDSTILLRALLARDVDACLGPLWDPAAVRSAIAAGPGAKIALPIGGKAGEGSGTPLNAQVEIVAVLRDAHQSWAGTRMKLGDCCLVRMNRVEIVLCSVRDQAYGPDLFTNLGVAPQSKRIVAVKSAQHFMAGFVPIAARVILAGGGGPLENDFRRIAYQHIVRPKWPLDDLLDN